MAFYSNLHWLNSANISLISKKEGAEEVTDFCPISLIHAIAKLISKMMAAHLAPHMNKLVSNAQSAFIKKRSIHDNFLYMSKTLHGSFSSPRFQLFSSSSTSRKLSIRLGGIT
jgi:hypothetical protein